VIIRGKLLLPCGLRVEGRIRSKENEEYEILEFRDSSREEEALLVWPSIYENEKNVDWYLRVLYGFEMKQVCYVYFLFEFLYPFCNFIFYLCE
jgi:hypothetical protein